MRLILYFLLLVAAPLLADQVAAARQQDHGRAAPAGDTDFLAAHDAYLAGDRVKLGRYAQRLKESPLEVYVSYYQLSLALKNSPAQPAPDSLTAAVKAVPLPPGRHAGDRPLRVEWLKALGNRQQWDLFDAVYPRVLEQWGQRTVLLCAAIAPPHPGSRPRFATRADYGSPARSSRIVATRCSRRRCRPASSAERDVSPAAAPDPGSEQCVIRRQAGQSFVRPAG